MRVSSRDGTSVVSDSSSNLRARSPQMSNRLTHYDPEKHLGDVIYLFVVESMRPTEALERSIEAAGVLFRGVLPMHPMTSADVFKLLESEGLPEPKVLGHTIIRGYSTRTHGTTVI